MRKTVIVMCLSVVAIGLLPQSAVALTAGTVKCPDPIISTDPNGANNQYTVTPALDCVYSPTTNGDHNINGDTNDEFLDGLGLEEDSYGDLTTAGATFGKTWTGICANSTPTGACSGLSITAVTGPDGGTSANWEVTDNDYLYYALGVKDGSAPKWAVFLLDSTQLSGAVSMIGGSFSHFALYGSGTLTSTNQNLEVVPEPASLLLLSTGLAVAGRQLRKRRARQTAAL